MASPPLRGPYKQGQRKKQGIPKGMHVNKAGRAVANTGRRAAGAKGTPGPRPLKRKLCAGTVVGNAPGRYLTSAGNGSFPGVVG